MDGSIDPAIDPAMDQQPAIFSLEGELDHHHHHNTNHDDAQRAAHAALLAHNQDSYNFAHSQSDAHDPSNDDTAAVEAAAAAAAANISSIINFNQMENDASSTASLDHDHHQHTNQHLSSTRAPLPSVSQSTRPPKHQSQLQFLQNALTIERPSQDQTSIESSPAHGPKQVLIKDPSSKMSIVVVNPAQKEGSGRLGRPRRSSEKNHDKANKSLMESSSSNQEDSLLSTFRVDARPVIGPGSRGGKARPPVKKPVERKNGGFVNYKAGSSDTGGPVLQQSKDLQIIDMSPSQESNDDVVIVSETTKADPPTEPSTASPSSEVDPQLSNTDPVETGSKSPESSALPLTNSFILEDFQSIKDKGRSVRRDKADVFTKLGLVPLMPKNQTSSNTPSPGTETKKNTRTRRAKPAVTRARDLKKKDIPGPITPATWDVYDPELLNLADEKNKKKNDSGAKGKEKDISEDVEVVNMKMTRELIALGYEVKPVPYAKDIMIILAFVAKFKKFFKELPNLGPQDFEDGLKLNRGDESTRYPVDNANQIDATKTQYENDEVSETMHTLLRNLLTLLLNRKKPILGSGVTKALYDLKDQVLTYGLPAEWRDDTGVYATPGTDASLNDPEGSEPVDPNQTEIFDTVQYHYGTTKPLEHTPLDNPDFETEGLQSLNPMERLVLLRSLVYWCSAHSDAVRNEVNAQISRQDASGEKDTYYVSRFVKQGQDGVEAANSSLKLHPRKKIKKTEDDADNTADAYTDASVNPLDHHMSFRLLDFYAGDTGVNGRFFLCRSADHTSGGFSSVAEWKALTESDTPAKSMIGQVQPSRFKLYVEDVTTMLTSVLETETCLAESTENKEALDPWYEVASNTAELSAFIEYLAVNLQTTKSKSLKTLHNYLNGLLPVLVKYETIYTEYTALTLTRDSRKRGQMTDLKAQDLKLRKIIQQSENPEDEFLRNDSDEEMEEAEDDDDDDDFMEQEEPDDYDDDDDDDYKG